jgi:hypothetical protein
MYELRDPSVAQRITLAGLAAVWVALVWWLRCSASGRPAPALLSNVSYFERRVVEWDAEAMRVKG